jgi:adenylyltransferase/sulfurtransferase
MTSSVPLLRPEQSERHWGYPSLPEFGVGGRRKPLEGSVPLTGAGALGCPRAVHLAAVGVGRIGQVVSDVVDSFNLQRQVLYGMADVGRPEVEVARKRIEAWFLTVDSEVPRY